MSRLPTITRGGPLPAKTDGPAPDAARGGQGLSARRRDFLLLNIFVLAQQGYIDRAGVLAEALHMAGDGSAEVLLARAVLRFLAGEWTATLACLEDLDRVDPLERFGAYMLSEPQRMRRFLAARCLFERGETARARDALDVYLRHGAAGNKTERE